MRRISMVLALVLVLAGCQVTVPNGPTPPPPTVHYTFQAQSAAFPPQPTARGNVSLPANQDRVIRIQSGPVSNDPTRMMVVEVTATTGTRLEVFDAGGQLIGASRSPQFFASSLAAASASSAGAAPDVDAAQTAVRARTASREREVDLESISVVWNCLGPCVAFRPTSTTTSHDYYVVVRAATSQNAQVFAYVTTEQDDNEPNNTLPTATTVPPSLFVADVSGAIERLGDQDFFRIPQTGWGSQFVEVELVVPNAPPQLDIYLEFMSDGFRLRPGDDPAVADVGEVFVVRAHIPGTGTARAGPAAPSRYIVFVEPL